MWFSYPVKTQTPETKIFKIHDLTQKNKKEYSLKWTSSKPKLTPREPKQLLDTDC
jgi:hypothetical protein